MQKKFLSALSAYSPQERKEKQYARAIPYTGLETERRMNGGKGKYILFPFGGAFLLAIWGC